MPTGTQINEGNVENGKQIIIVEDKISKYSVYFKYLHVFLYFCSLNHYVLFNLKDKFLFHLFFKSKF